MVPQFLMMLQQQNPQLYQLFTQYPQLFAAILSGNMQEMGENPEEQFEDEPEGEQGEQFVPPQGQPPA